jgi:asparagine synthase (glutamine-hydrolysing)
MEADPRYLTGMCGIAGCVYVPGGIEEGAARQAVQRMTDRLAARGPDGSGLWGRDGVVFGHRRLAIIDLDTRASQPMVSADGRFTIVFNGEIYNFQQLRDDLVASGIAFRTTSDTEVLLALFARDAERMLSKLRGMFSIAIWDSQMRKVFLARDPYGIKPLYYTVNAAGLIFASQVKALLASGLVPDGCEPAALAGFYLWGSVAEPWTMVPNVLALPAGHYMWGTAAAPGTPVCWHDIRQHWRVQEGVPNVDVREAVRSAVMESVRSHLVADVPVSVFLSGGIDSATIAAHAVGLGAKVAGVTVGFREFEGTADDEVPMAASIAAYYKIPHSVRWIARSEFEADVPRIMDAMDQPSVDGVNTWFASKAAAELGYKVVLSGVGGDELFCGYPSFTSIPRVARVGGMIAALPGVSRSLRAPFALLSRLRAQPKVTAVPRMMSSIEGLYFLTRALFLPEELPALMGKDQAALGLARLGGVPPGMTPATARDNISAVGLLESTHYLRNQLLRDSDWSSMAHSLELRTPLVDAELVRDIGPYVSRFSRGRGKVLLAHSPPNALPENVIRRRKTGFGLPIGRWLSESAARSHLTKSRGPWARDWARAIVASLEG